MSSTIQASKNSVSFVIEVQAKGNTWCILTTGNKMVIMVEMPFTLKLEAEEFMTGRKWYYILCLKHSLKRKTKHRDLKAAAGLGKLASRPLWLKCNRYNWRCWEDRGKQISEFLLPWQALWSFFWKVNWWHAVSWAKGHCCVLHDTNWLRYSSLHMEGDVHDQSI